MKKLITLLLAATFTAQAGTAFFKYEYTSGMNKVCVYDHMGSDVAITIKAYKLCPLSVNA